MKTEVAVTILVCLTLAQGQMYDELYKEVMSRGTKHTIPMKSKTDTVNVSLSLDLLRVKSLSADTGDAELETWMSYKWKDNRLTWSPADYNNATELRLPYSSLWSPDIVLYNGHEDSLDLNAVVKNDGSIIKIPPSTIKTQCDVRNYLNYGTITCELKFGSWTYNGHQIDINVGSEAVGTSNYNQGLWEVITKNGTRDVKYYSCCPEPYISVIFKIVFRNRRVGHSWSLFY